MSMRPSWFTNFVCFEKEVLLYKWKYLPETGQAPPISPLCRVTDLRRYAYMEVT